MWALATTLCTLIFCTLTSSQLLLEPSPPSSDPDLVLDIPEAKLECFETCTMPFLSQARMGASSPKGADQMCQTWLQMKDCVLECPEGAEMLSMIGKMVPQSFKLIQQMCGQSGEGTPSPDAVLAILQEGSEMKEADYCVTNCEQYIQPMISGGSGISDQRAMCASWHQYEQCVVQCPQGADTMAAVKNAFPTVFGTIEDHCGPSSAVIDTTGFAHRPSFAEPVLVSLDLSTDATTDIFGSTESTESPMPTESTESPMPTESTESPMPTESTESPMPTESTESPMPTESTESPMPTESTESPMPTESTESPMPTESTESITASELSPDYRNIDRSTTDYPNMPTDIESLRALVLNMAASTDYPLETSEATQMSAEFVDSYALGGSSRLMLSCKGNCIVELDGIDVSAGTDKLCDTWFRFMSCLDQCQDPEVSSLAIVKDLRRIMPKTVEYLGTHCLPGDDAPPSLDPQTIQDMLAEEQASDQMELCIQDCEIHVDALRSTSLPSLTDVCINWGNYRNCLDDCPGGDATFDIVRQIMPEMVDFIQTTCGGLSLTSSQDSIIPMEELTNSLPETVPSTTSTTTTLGTTTKVIVEDVKHEEKMPSKEANPKFFHKDALTGDVPASAAPVAKMGSAFMVGCLILARFGVI